MMNIKPYKPRDWKSHPPYRYEDYASSVKRAPLKRLVPMKQTLSEITGPIFGHETSVPEVLVPHHARQQDRSQLMKALDHLLPPFLDQIPA